MINKGKLYDEYLKYKKNLNKEIGNCKKKIKHIEQNIQLLEKQNNKLSKQIKQIEIPNLYEQTDIVACIYEIADYFWWANSYIQEEITKVKNIIYENIISRVDNLKELFSQLKSFPDDLQTKLNFHFDKLKHYFQTYHEKEENELIKEAQKNRDFFWKHREIEKRTKENFEELLTELGIKKVIDDYLQEIEKNNKDIENNITENKKQIDNLNIEKGEENIKIENMKKMTFEEYKSRQTNEQDQKKILKNKITSAIKKKTSKKTHKKTKKINKTEVKMTKKNEQNKKTLNTKISKDLSKIEENNKNDYILSKNQQDQKEQIKLEKKKIDKNKYLNEAEKHIRKLEERNKEKYQLNTKQLKINENFLSSQGILDERNYFSGYYQHIGDRYDKEKLKQLKQSEKNKLKNINKDKTNKSNKNTRIKEAKVIDLYAQFFPEKNNKKDKLEKISINKDINKIVIPSLELKKESEIRNNYFLGFHQYGDSAKGGYYDKQLKKLKEDRKKNKIDLSKIFSKQCVNNKS